MSIAPALTADELTAFAGPSTPDWCAVYDTVDGNVVATARANIPSGVTFPLSDLPVDGTLGWSDVAPDMTIFLGSTPGGFDKGIFRVRRDTIPADSLPMMAVGANDSGLVNVAVRRNWVVDDDYVTVLRRFDPFGVYPHIDYPGSGLEATIYEDWLNSQYILNRYPPPIVNLFIDGQPSNYGAHVRSATSKIFDIDFEILLWPTSSDVDWEIILPASWTLNSGSLTGSGETGTINVTAPHSADSYTISLAATENNGSTFTAYRKVWIKSFTYPPLSIVRIDSDVDDRIGSRRTITFNSLPAIAPGGLWHLFDAGSWNGSDVPTARKCFSGYVERRSEVTDIGVASVTLSLVGPSYMLDLIGGQSQIMTAVNATPASFQEVYYLLSYLDFIIWWILFQRASGFLQMYNYTPFGLANTQKRMTDWRIDTATLLAQLRRQAERYGGGNFGCDPTGEFMLRRQVSRVPWAERSDIPVRATLDAGMYSSATLDYDPRPKVRRIRGECFVSDGLTTNTPFWADAPIVPGQGLREEKIERLIADTASELYEVTGNEYQARNNPYPSGGVKIPKNFAAIYPAQMSRVSLDIAPALRFDGEAYEGYVLPAQVSYTHNADGTIDVDMAIEAETAGVIGVDVEIPVPDASQYNTYYQHTPFAPVPFHRSSNPNPASSSIRRPVPGSGGAAVYPRDGSLGFCGTATKAYVVTNLTGTPTYRDVTPSGLGSFQIKHGALKTGGTRAWLLVSDGTDSKVYTTANVFALPKPTWTAGASVTGVYRLVRAATAAGKIMIYNPSTGGNWTHTFTGGTDLNTWSNAGDSTNGTFSSSKWNDGGSALDGLGNYHRYVNIAKAFSAVLTGASFKFDMSKGFFSSDDLALIIATAGFAIILQSQLASATSSGSGQVFSWSGRQAVTGLNLRAESSFATSSGALTGSTAITEITLAGEGTDPFGGGSNTSVTRYSSDDGATFASAVVVGDSPSAQSGLDIQYNGSVSYGGAQYKTRKATTLGGAYSDDQSFATSPAVIETPWSTRNATSINNSGSSPQYLVGLDAPDSGSTLFWIVSGSPVDITPMISGNPGIPAGPDCLATYLGKYVAFLGSFGGTKHLITSKDGGGSWADRGAVDATIARVQRLAAAPGKLYLAGADLEFSNTFGVALAGKAKPSSADLLFFEAYH